MSEIVRRDELQAAIAARDELGAVGLAGVIVVCGLLAVIAVVSSR